MAEAHPRRYYDSDADTLAVAQPSDGCGDSGAMMTRRHSEAAATLAATTAATSTRTTLMKEARPGGGDLDPDDTTATSSPDDSTSPIATSTTQTATAPPTATRLQHDPDDFGGYLEPDGYLDSADLVTHAATYHDAYDQTTSTLTIKLLRRGLGPSDMTTCNFNHNYTISTRRSIPTRRTMQAGGADVPATLLRLMDTDQAMDHADATSTPPPSSCMENVKRRPKTMTTTA
ncbi:unnamed protein product [Urochloa humidicola]